ncbi:hypothetical protein FDECE_12538 [Fusarium decemcellulare]|nr:hypothetical protein FDECE_12538 [Fusarium decemcellulare]
MIPSTTPSTTATATIESVVALTSAFREPFECGDNWATSVYSGRYQGRRTIQTVLISQPVSSCLPSGWDPQLEPHFSPGVCPSDWTYYDMNNYNGASTTDAMCCTRGFTYTGIYSEIISLTRPCVQMINMNGESEDDDSERPRRGAFEQTLRVHEALAVAWDRSDTSTLTPKPLLLTTATNVPTWSPGRKIPDDDDDDDNTVYTFPPRITFPDGNSSTEFDTESTDNKPTGLKLLGIIMGAVFGAALLMYLCCCGCCRSEKIPNEEQTAPNIDTVVTGPATPPPVAVSIEQQIAALRASIPLRTPPRTPPLTEPQYAEPREPTPPPVYEPAPPPYQKDTTSQQPAVTNSGGNSTDNGPG